MIVQKTKKTDLDHILIHRETVLPNRAIMLFHGLTGSPYELKKYAKFLFDKGFDVYCYCLPGHGSHEIDIYSVKERDWRDIMNLEKIMQIFLSEDYALGQCLP